MNKISIIIPAYNTVDVINRTLKSIEKQTYSNYEIIIVNDGSTDTTKLYLDNYKKDKDNVVIYHQENQGVSAARNKGIELATGEFVCFLDSDDTYEPTFLEEMIKQQQQTRANAVYCGFNRINSKNEKSKGTKNYYQNNIIDHFFESSLGFPCLFHLSCLVIKKSVIVNNNIEFEVGRNSSEDILFIVKILNQEKIFLVNQCLFNYIYRENSVCNIKKTESAIKSDIGGWEVIRNYVQDLIEPKFIDKKRILNFIDNHIVGLILGYATQLLVSFKYKDIKYFIHEISLQSKYMNLDKNCITKSNHRKFYFVTSNKIFTLLWGSVYYKLTRKI